MQRSIVESRGPSILDEFWQVKTPPEEGQDRVQILPPDGKTPRTVRLTSRSLTIGRGSENDIVLDDRRVSRQHLRLEFDGQNYQITDLNSTNGSYLDNNQLLPGIPEVWPPDKPLRLGGHYLHLWRGRGPAVIPGGQSGQPSFARTGGSLVRADGSLINPSQIRTSADDGVVISSMRPPRRRLRRARPSQPAWLL